MIQIQFICRKHKYGISIILKITFTKYIQRCW